MENKTITTNVPEGFIIQSVQTYKDRVVIKIEPKETKNFEWYKKEYCIIHILPLSHTIYSFPTIHIIGLFKFICDDLDIKWYEVINYFIVDWYTGHKATNPEISKLNGFLPKEFIESLKK